MPLVSLSNDDDGDYCNTKKRRRKKKKNNKKKVLKGPSKKGKIKFCPVFKKSALNVNLRMLVKFHPFLLSAPGRGK